MEWFERSLQRAKERATPPAAPPAPAEPIVEEAPAVEVAEPAAEEAPAAEAEVTDEKPAKRSRSRKA